MELSEITDFKAEAGVISTLVYHPEFILHSPHLQDNYFFDTPNMYTYWAIKQLLNQKITNVTAMNLEQMLESNTTAQRKMKDFNLPSMQEYIGLCSMSKRDTVEEYLLLVNRVVELAFKRSFYIKTCEWQRKCFNNDIDLDGMGNGVYKELSELTTQFVTNGEITTIGEVGDKIWAEALARKERGESYGLPSFFDSLREYFTYEKTELVVIASRMKIGKSWVALIEAIHKAKSGVPVLIYDSEMSDSNWFFRAISYLTGIRESKIKNADLSPEEFKLVDEQRAYLKSLPIIHIFDPFVSDEKFYSICAQKQIDFGLGFVIFDYIKCSDDLLDASKRSAFMAGRTNFLKNKIAGELNLPVLAFAQLGRNGEVAESDGIERNTSVSVRWERKTTEEMSEDGPECGTNKMTVKLNRIGKCHLGEKEYVDMTFLKDRPGIVEARQHVEANPYE